MNEDVGQGMKAPELNLTGAEKAKQIPDPAGFRILCIVPDLDTKFDGSVLERPNQVLDQDRFATAVLFVLKIGPDAFKDKQKFPSGPLCKEGDMVICRQYSGTRFKIHGREFRIVFDDMVEAVVQDPRGIGRV